MESSDSLFPSFKLKRDEYLVEIRKKKNNDQLQTKRKKLASNAFNQNKDEPIEELDISTLPPLKDLAVEFLNQVNQGSIENITKVLGMIRAYICQDDNPPVTELVQTGIVPHIIELLRMDFYHHEKLIIECSWISANIVSGDSDSTEYLVSLQIIPKALELLEHNDIGVNENAVYILANIAGENFKDRDQIIKKGGVNHIDSLLTKRTSKELDPGFVSNIAWLISNLCRGRPYPDFPEIASFLPVVEHFLKSDQAEDTTIHSMWTLAAITNGNESQIKEVLGMDIGDVLLACLNSKNYRLLIPTLKTIGNIFTGEDEDSQILLNNGIIGGLYRCLEHEHHIVRKNAAWVYSNILAGTQDQVQEVFDFEYGIIIDKLIYLIHKDEKVEVAEECIYALTNAADSGTLHTTNELVRKGAIELFLEVLQIVKSGKLISAVLNSLNNILLEGDQMAMGAPEEGPIFLRFYEHGGIKLLEMMQNTPVKEAYESIESILNRYKV